jgi:hypothetical protein
MVVSEIDPSVPGTVRPVVGGGAVVSCNPGAVFFNVAEPVG